MIGVLACGKVSIAVSIITNTVIEDFLLMLFDYAHNKKILMDSNKQLGLSSINGCKEFTYIVKIGENRICTLVIFAYLNSIMNFLKRCCVYDITCSPNVVDGVITNHPHLCPLIIEFTKYSLVH